MKPLRCLGIVGVGLLGGSLGLVARRDGLAGEVVGVGRSQANLDVALQRGCVDRVSQDPAILSGADLVVLATPVGSLADMARRVAGHLPPGAIVTDVGSSKVDVVRDCTAALGESAQFVGSHPIAGMERSGAAAAREDLFEGARCIVTPVAGTDPEARDRVCDLWRALGMDVHEMSPDDHDAILALTSHLPHVVSWALAGVLAERRDGPHDPLRHSGPSLRDMTRVAASSPEMWRDILLSNSEAILSAIAGFRDRVDQLSDAIARRDTDTLDRILVEAGDVRRQLEGARDFAPIFASGADEVEIAAAAGGLRGTIDLPGDKSIGHRSLILGGIAEGVTEIRGLSRGEDNLSTQRVLRALGVAIEREGDWLRILGRGFAGLQKPTDVLDCGNSGTTIRMMSGVLAGLPFEVTLDGDASLRRRPMTRVTEPLTRLGAQIEADGGRPPIRVHGGALQGARFELDVASAQVKTCLLLAGLQARGETRVVEPGPSRDHTERLLPIFGAPIERPDSRTVVVHGGSPLRGARIEVPADPSAAAFWLVAASIVPGSRLTLRGVSINPTRTGALDVLLAMGAQIRVRERAPMGDEPLADLIVETAPLHGTEVSGETMLRAIDEFPVLAVAAALARGTTRFTDGAELRVKESDRLAAVGRGLATLGVTVREAADGMTVQGTQKLGGGVVDSFGDHRIAMAFAVAGLVARQPVRIRQAGAIAVSDPDFLQTLARLRSART